MAHEYAVRLALIAFATASIQGLISNADFQPAVQTSLIALAVFYVLGYVCGELAQRIVEESFVAAVQNEAAASAASPTSGRSAAGK